MEYIAEYTLLINGATWGRREETFEADSDEEAAKLALDYEAHYYIKRPNGSEEELLLDYLYNEDGKEVEVNRE